MTGMLRLTGGTLSRRLIAVPEAAKKGTLRPTSDRVREALFSTLTSRFDLHGARVADVCCGSGALGFEALSRGADRATFVDDDGATLDTVRRSAASLAVLERCTFVKSTASRFLERADAVDVAFFDPPYAMVLDPALRAGLTRLVQPGGLLIVERASRSEDMPFEALSLLVERRYGDTRVMVWQKQEHT
jgi:16S rRNA (guanine966-N2)-methyltransferase